MKGTTLSDEQLAKINSIPTETTEEFLARGGNVIKLQSVVSIKKSNKKKIAAQHLLDKAIKSGCGEEVIQFLKKQGFEVE